MSKHVDNFHFTMCFRRTFGQHRDRESEAEAEASIKYFLIHLTSSIQLQLTLCFPVRTHVSVYPQHFSPYRVDDRDMNTLEGKI
ncbi:hypothetical protein CFAM422_003949 [Trichoderma lentiforme]|uniref:Uncharacterized protein n=1 Tax=Trichoderma lentiforme TaxID=1567552 RepID=A0A9P4XLA3_9HYPO|nr:hypothetical protein CFAM422_003949 [Trichoderma lentiforme]